MFGIMMDATLPDDIRDEIITSAIKKSIATGKSDHLLDMTSPRTQRMKERFDYIINNCSNDDQQMLLTKVTHDWISQRSVTSLHPTKSLGKQTTHLSSTATAPPILPRQLSFTTRQSSHACEEMDVGQHRENNFLLSCNGP
jgi:hypothetical protein